MSRRHLAALEKGANVSVVLLMKVAAALELPVLDVGDDLRLVLGERTGASSAALLDCADEIEEGIARSQKVVTKLRETAEGKADDNDPLRVRASALLQSFLKEVRSLDAAEQVERLQGLTVQATRPRKRSKKVS